MPPTPDTLGPRATLDFYDERSLVLPRDINPLDAYHHMTRPFGHVLRTAFWLRDAISTRFGVKPIGGFGGDLPTEVRAGERLDFFLVERTEADHLTLTERDGHLDVMLSVTVTERRLTIISSVKTHNLYGRLYMLPVAPIHKLLLRSYFRKLERSLSAEREA